MLIPCLSTPRAPRTKATPSWPAVSRPETASRRRSSTAGGGGGGGGVGGGAGAPRVAPPPPPPHRQGAAGGSARRPEPLDTRVLTDYWFGDLPESEQDHVEEHLLECHDCSRALSELVAIGDGVRRLTHQGAFP